MFYSIVVYMRLFTDIVFLSHVYNEHKLLWVKYVGIVVRRKVSKILGSSAKFFSWENFC